MLGTYRVPSPGSVTINRYGICLLRVTGTGGKQDFHLSKVPSLLTKLILGVMVLNMQRDAQAFTHLPTQKTTPKLRGNLGPDLALREALSEGGFCYLPALGLKPQGGPLWSSLLLLGRTCLGEIVGGSQAEGHVQASIGREDWEG